MIEVIDEQDPNAGEREERTRSDALAARLRETQEREDRARANAIAARERKEAQDRESMPRVRRAVECERILAAANLFNQPLLDRAGGAIAAIAGRAEEVPAVAAARERAESLAGRLAETRTQEAEAGAAVERATARVREELTAGGDWLAAEAERDDAQAQAARLSARARDLEHAHARAAAELERLRGAAVNRLTAELRSRSAATVADVGARKAAVRAEQALKLGAVDPDRTAEEADIVLALLDSPPAK